MRAQFEVGGTSSWDTLSEDELGEAVKLRGTKRVTEIQ